MTTDSQLEIHCPKCGSTQLSANKKGFSGKKAVAGVLVTGGIGLFAGTIGSNKIIITCLNCGKDFKPGEGKTLDPNHSTKMEGVTYGTPKLIWDPVQKRHIPNPEYKASAAASVSVIIIIAVVLLLLFLFLRASI
ncbi:hypothetical protein KHS38_17285 [Mucilaginibacter sp. Bleaf8]|uniref:hypothetical protein n=1 Tax=Mucilaginibacter sp. Bleaf8 TaxID=2834430 RepID=UPI001BD1245A|nr:hypothetical protein [Mucilaginibacter sp. Bleaf8]MBS7566166.1 hypothetical protein [Mucilaginibacter sp. Bleaf8]